MFSFIVRRLITLPFVLFAVSIIIVGLLQFLSPEQRAVSFIRSEQQLQNLDRIIVAYGLDQPFHVQYGIWLREALSGNLGFSRTSSRPVLQTIQERLPVSAELAFYSVFPIILFGIWMGTRAALNKDGIWDQIIRVASIVGWSLPTFVLAIWLLVIFYGGYGLFGIGRVSSEYIIEIARGEIRTPTGFMTLDAILNWRWDLWWDAIVHLVLPVTSLVVVICAQYIRVMRSSLLDALSQDYVRTARAKGLSANSVNLKHARRNALIPIVTLSGFTFAGLLNGTLFVETIFAIEGLGRWAATSTLQFDVPALLGFAIFTAVIIVVANLLVDILYAVVDPRIRYD